MANLRETSTWEVGIYQWETSDPVMGGENGIDNRPTRQLANRTLWLKNEIARAIALIGTNQQTATQQFALKTTSLTAGAGLTGGGVLRDNMTLSLGTPSKITANSQNSAVSNTHTHEIDKASTSVAGIVQLSSALNSEAENLAATPKAVKAAFERASLITLGVDSARDANQIAVDNIPLAVCNVNVPKTGHWYVINVKYSVTSNVGQIAWQYLHNQPQELWTRAKYNDTWGAWTRIDGVDWENIRGNPLSIRTQSPSVDANGLKTDGVYAFGGGGLNLPTTTGAYHLVVTAGSNASWCRQTAYKAYTNERYVRTLTSSNGNWGAWVRDDGAAWADIRDKPALALDGDVVKLSGNQTIGGEKTFSGSLNVLSASGVSVKHSDRTFVFAIGTDSCYLHNTKSSKTLRLKDNGTLTYAEQPVYHGGNKPTWADLGYAPVQQGGGVGQNNNAIKIGWSGSRLKAQVDGTDLGNIVFDSHFSGQKTQSGYQKLPNGLILQWGEGMAGRAGTILRVHFPIAFTSKVLNIQAIHLGEDVNVNLVVQHQNIDTTGFNVKSNYAHHDVIIHWFAIGY